LFYVRELFRIIDRLKHAGTSIVYISHFLEEVFQVADRVTVMRDGKVVAVHQVEDLDRRELVRLMLGRDIQSGDKVRVPSAADKAGMGEAVLSVDGLSCNGKLEGISFKLHPEPQLMIIGYGSSIGSSNERISKPFQARTNM
jgi:ABC-type sugar transport system ATPase subunit